MLTQIKSKHANIHKVNTSSLLVAVAYVLYMCQKS